MGLLLAVAGALVATGTPAQAATAITLNGASGGRVFDSDWSVANDVNSNPAFASAVSIIGADYPCGYLGAESSCTVPAAATSSGKALWASENGSED